MTHNEALLRSGTSVRQTVKHILTVWEASTATQREQGAQWYLEAQTIALELADAGNVSVETSAAVIAHLSPRTPWARNVAGATALLMDGTQLTGIMGAPYARALTALTAPEPILTLKGPKIRSFARNILGDTDAVTVDVWATRVALGDREDADKVLTRKGVYDAVAHCYRLAARKAGVTPATMQATTWIVARNGRAD